MTCTINGVSATVVAQTASSYTSNLTVTFIARVPTGSGAVSIDLDFINNISGSAITWYTFRPASLTPLYSQGNVTQGTTFPQFAVSPNYVIFFAGLTTSGTATYTWSGVDSPVTDVPNTVYYSSAHNFSARSIITSESATRNLSYTATNWTYPVLLMFGAQAQFTDTIAETIGTNDARSPAMIYLQSMDEGSLLQDLPRHTPIVTITDTLGETFAFDQTSNVRLATQLFEIIGHLGTPNIAQMGYASENVGAYDFANSATVVSATDVIGNTDTPTYAYVLGPTLLEQIGISDPTTPGLRYAILTAERFGLQRAVIVAIPVTVADTAAVNFAVSASRAVTMIERLQLADTLLGGGRYNVTQSDQIAITDALRRFFGGDVMDTMAVTDSLSRVKLASPTVTETVGVNDSLTQQLIVRVIAQDTVGIHLADALKMLYKPVVEEGVEIAAAYISPGDSVTTWAVNTKNFATTEYTNFNFNSFAPMGNKYLGASSTGLYELNGDTDAGTNIISDIKSGLMQLGGSRFSSFKAAYLGMRGDGNFVLKLETGDGKTYNYAVVGKDMQTSRVHFGKGLRARYFSFELISTGQDFDLDSIEFIPLVAQRRV